jgi:hypothetical protein
MAHCPEPQTRRPEHQPHPQSIAPLHLGQRTTVGRVTSHSTKPHSSYAWTVELFGHFLTLGQSPLALWYLGAAPGCSEPTTPLGWSHCPCLMRSFERLACPRHEFTHPAVCLTSLASNSAPNSQKADSQNTENQNIPIPKQRNQAQPNDGIKLTRE